MTPRVLGYCAIGGFALTLPALGAGHVVLWWLSGALLAAAFAPVALYPTQPSRSRGWEDGSGPCKSAAGS
jgi:hypothetical protein